MFDVIDATGSGYHSDPRMREIEGEMIRSHELCLKISLIIRVCWKSCSSMKSSGSSHRQHHTQIRPLLPRSHAGHRSESQI